MKCEVFSDEVLFFAGGADDATVAQVEDAAGLVAPRMNDRVTHVIANAFVTPELAKKANDIGSVIVLPTWVDECLKKKTLVDESGFCIGISKKKKSKRTASGSLVAASHASNDDDDDGISPPKKVKSGDVNTGYSVGVQKFLPLSTVPFAYAPPPNHKVPLDPQFVTEYGSHGSYEVYQDSDGIYNEALVQIGFDFNKFYNMQLIQEVTKKSFVVWLRWGRAGTPGEYQTGLYSNFATAKAEFTKKFFEKTGVLWENRNGMTPQPGKYDRLVINYNALSLPSPTKPDAKSGGLSLDITVRELVELICDIKKMKSILIEFSIDTDRMPLGKLSQQQLKKGFLILTQLETALMSGTATKSTYLDLSNQFYTLIPHSFGKSRPPILDSMMMLKDKLGLLEALANMEIAGKLLSGPSTPIEDPIETHYKMLNASIIPVAKHSPEWDIVEKYIKFSHAPTHDQYTLSLHALFSVTREVEQKRFTKDISNRMLLWHGSRLTNFMGIISQGLKIAPPEAPVTGYMFGKGLYFADSCSKSANYCHTSKSDNTGCLLLCDVALGPMHRLRKAKESLTYSDMQKVGCMSTFGEGKNTCDPSQTITIEDGIQVPLGKIVPSGITVSELLYNEYIVYRVEQARMKYLVQLKFHYK
eukprot:TRINITY_DN997_c0_g1_i3.p1 TRINITY_DN997_c0_g1~~TRINITY_DN997_c0_g1_i3.p1  ORF type:complete len:643 (-),score=202.36 TRINITY_DN997_c0_g1_i3:129-2057(-)